VKQPSKSGLKQLYTTELNRYTVQAVVEILIVVQTVQLREKVGEAIAYISLGGLPPGKFRELNPLRLNMHESDFSSLSQ